MITVLSPAKKLKEKKVQSSLKETSQPIFLDESTILMDALKKMKVPAIGKLMKLSANLAELNFERFQSWTKKHDQKNSKPAILTFNGDAYLGLNVEDFSIADFEFAQNHLRILSGLYGLLRPTDLIQAYRLEMGKKLSTKKHNNLYRFWGDKICEQLNKDIEESESSYLINLASNEYFKAVNAKQIKAKIITCEFKQLKNNEYKTIMVYAKKARGMMSRFIIKNKINNIEDLLAFNIDGYLYSPKMSNNHNLVYIRK